MTEVKKPTVTTVKKNGSILNQVPIGLAAVYQHSCGSGAIDGINQNGTTSLWLEAVRERGSSLRDVPKPMRTEELCSVALEHCPAAIAFIDVDVREEAMGALRGLQLAFPTTSISSILSNLPSLNLETTPLDQYKRKRRVRRLRGYVFEFERTIYRESEERRSTLKTMLLNETDVPCELVELIAGYDAICHLARLYPSFSNFWLDFFS